MSRKSTTLWILAFDVFVSLLAVIISHSVHEVVADVGSSGRISIDCGVTRASRDKNGFYYEGDDGTVVESGEIHNVNSTNALDSQDDQAWQQLNTLRSFPQGQRNCYTLQPKQGKNNNYLVRVFYYHGNYDNKDTVPEFDLHLGVNFWTETQLDGIDYYKRMEVIHASPTNNIDVCLVNTGHGIPFISLLELWPLNNFIYTPASNSLPLDLMTRSSLGNPEPSKSFIRYADDIYGRTWFLNRTIKDSEPFNTLVAIDDDLTGYRLPKDVLKSAIRPRNGSSSLVINLDYDTNYAYYVYLHFFDFEEHPQNQQRQMAITFPDKTENITLKSRVPQTVEKPIPKGQPVITITITSSPTSRLPPMLNAFEAYRVLPQPNSPTREGDVHAMRLLKHAYSITRNWQGDPCMPSNYSWEGLTCNYTDHIPEITSLNLSSSKLTGDINTSFSDLISLTSLDLSNNQLVGEIPELLAQLPNLKLLNLSGNNLSGSIPKALREKNGTSLILSLDGNPSLCQIGACNTKTQKRIIPIIASVVASVAVLVIAVCISVKFCKHKRIKQSGMEGIQVSSFENDGNIKSKNREFNHVEVLSITNYFENVIGEGGFGKVYLGTLQGGTQVAVKVLSKSSQQGFKEFQSEAELLMLVYHRNLVSLVGYCNDGDTKALIYEYLTEGNLRQKLSDKNPCPLKWNERLQIALDAACGLDYLHNGCKPAIIHRDVKTSNILLNKNMQAKIADFGLSRAFLDDTNTQLSTRLAGTPGYLDPEFHSSGNLNKKSDVYSFGIILLELMAGRPAVIGSPGNATHICDWVAPKLERGDIQSIMDPRLEGQFNTASAWKFLEIAMSCVPPIAIQRPDIGHVVADLKECLSSEISLQSAEINNSGIFDSYFTEPDSVPCAR